MNREFLCAICFQPIDLTKKCKTDEDGRPVHDSCYSMTKAATVPSSFSPKKTPKPVR